VIERVIAAVILLGAGSGFSATDEERHRARMVRDQIEARGITNRQVIAALRKVPRDQFVPERYREAAYDDGPLPIGYGQTISQPYIVALMTELAALPPGGNALEIGTGSAYQAAVLAEITTNVCTIEIIEPLATSAAARLKRLGYDTVRVKFGDGYFGWKEHAPFDAILVTAAADHVPPPLIEQLKPGGRMVIPLGSPFHTQWLVVVQKDAAGRINTRNVAPVVFVPLRRQAQ
jgi:protein-L-isoaspartate(D-aspartate) O-methyltransferase